MSESPNPTLAVDLDRARRIARARIGHGDGKGGFRSKAPIAAPDADYVGANGELAFAAWTSMRMDEGPRPSGDGGVDFRHALSIDVKTFRKPGHLLVPEGKVRADLYVLAGLDEPNAAVTLLGWAWGWEVRLWPLDTAGRFNPTVHSHYHPTERLHPIRWLLAILGLWQPDRLDLGAEQRKATVAYGQATLLS